LKGFGKQGDRIMQIIEYEPEDFRFESLSELKFCILCGSEITFIYQNHIYGIGQIAENKFYIGSCITPEQPKCDDDLISDNVEDILNYSLGDRKLRECLNDIEVIERTL